MFESGLIYANEGETMFRAEDIINIDRHFAALQYAITECIHSLSGGDIQEIQRRLGTGQNIPGDIEEQPKTLRDIAAFHIEQIKIGGDAKVARIIAFVQCLQADIAPFIIHAENKEEYEGRLDSSATACIYAQQAPLYIKRPVNDTFYSSDHHLTEFIINIALLNDQGKLISTDAEGIVCLPDTFTQSPGNRLQQSVPHVMSISVINRLKPVQIQIEHGKFFMQLSISF